MANASHAAATLAAVVTLFCVDAGAHPGHARSERLVKLSLGETPAQVAYGLVFTPWDTIELRRKADADADGKVSAGEEAAALARETQALLGHLTICRGHDARAMECDRASPSQVLETSSAGYDPSHGPVLAMSWTVSLGLREGDLAVKVVDAWSRPEVDRSDALIEAHPGHPLTGAGAGEPATDVVTQFAWDSTAEPRVLFAAWESTPARWPVIVAALAAALALAAQIATRRRAPRVTSDTVH